MDKYEIAVTIYAGCIVMFFLAVIIFLFVVTYQRKMVIMETNLKLIEQEKQLEVYKASVNAEEKLKKEIASNLHDEINPLLNALKFNLGKYRLKAKNKVFEPDELINDELVLDKAIDGIRSVCYDLTPSFFLKYGLVPSLEAYINNITKAGKLKGNFINEISPDALDAYTIEEQLNIYRICMELLTNLIKHGACSNFTLHISIAGAQLNFQITHDGKRISNEEIEMNSKASNGLGLKSLKARLLLLKATLNYYSEISLPNTVLLIPIKQA
jgi:signal transduction histidine kinase